MYQIPHEFHNETMHPAFSTRNSRVRIHNFYAETADVVEMMLGDKQVRKIV